MTWLRSLVFNLCFFGLSAVMALVGLGFLLLPPPRMLWVARIWSRMVLWLAKTICGLDYRLEGLEHRPSGAALVASKHQSAWDTLVYNVILERPVYVVKQELFRVPLFGRLMRHYGAIAVDREGGAKALKKLLADAEALMARGAQIVIFPEGTRVAPGTTGSYEAGIAALYRSLSVPLVPVALNSGHFWARRGFLKHAGTITLAFQEPIAPGGERRQVMATLRERIEGANAVLDADARRQRGTEHLPAGE